jgi:hypothetical protein
MDSQPVDPQTALGLEVLDRAAVHAALDLLLDAGADDGGEVLSGAMEASATVRTAIDGAMVDVLAAFERSMAWAAEGHRSPVSWMVAHLGSARPAAASERRVALGACSMPFVAAAAAAGQLSGAHLRLLVDARRRPVHDLFDRDEAMLVAEALQLSVDALRLRLQRWWWDALAEAGCNEPEADRRDSDRNTVRLSQGFAGRGLLDGDLCPEGYVTLAAAIDAEIERWRKEGTLDADPRTWNELRGDALLALVARGDAHPDRGAVRPLVVAVADVDTLLARSGLDPAERTARRADLVGGGPISDAAIAELASRAGLALLVTGGGRPLWFGRSRRLASSAQRLAVLATDGDRCYWPGCGAPAHRCQVDHLTGWEQGGRTDIANLGLICGFHNRLKHRAGYQAARAPDGRIVVTDATGDPVDPPFHQP